jgi:outer membrane protein assembly factor BamD (BamD/ComL family)
LEREIALLARARAKLRAGDAHGAQATLAQMQSQFPDRALRQERLVLGILAQNALGNREAARRSALLFVKAHPESPHDAQLARLIDQH